MGDRTYLYPFSRAESIQHHEFTLWQQSWDENIRCRKAIESAISWHSDGQTLNPDCAKPVIAEFGYKRVRFVLANSMQHLPEQAALSEEARQWASRMVLPDGQKAQISAANSPPLLEAFLSQYQNELQKLGLFAEEHCQQDSGSVDYEGKILVLSPEILKESCWRQEDQLWLALDGFGCSPTARGRSIRSICLGDGEMTRWNRHDFLGVLKPDYLPEWAKTQLQQLAPEHEQDAACCEMQMQ